MIEAQVPPNAVDLEAYVIASALWHKDAMPQVADILRGEHFYDVQLGQVWDTLVELFDKSLTLDAPTLVFEMARKQGLSPERKAELYYRIKRIEEGCLGMRNIFYNTLILGQYWISRKMIAEGTYILNQASDGSNDALDLVQSSSDRLNALMEQFVKGRGKSYHDAEASAISDMDRVREGIQTTGFTELDRIIGGYQGGDLVIVAARPAMGKSAFAFSSAAAGAEQGRPTGFFSLELNEDKGQARLLSRRTGIPLAAIIRNEMTTEQVKVRHANLDGLKKIPLHMRYDSGLSLTDIRSEAERMKRFGVRTIFVDQLNWIVTTKEQNRDRELGVVTRTLKLMASKMDICIVLLHQLSREVEKRSSKVPMMSDLRDSGNIEQDAQVVVMLYRPEYYGITEDDRGNTIGTVDAIVVKNTNGTTETARLRFDGPTASMHNLSGFGNQFEHAPF